MPKNRIQREKETVKCMLKIYCNDYHHPKSELCQQCQTLLEYAHLRLDKCKYAEKKPTCGRCTIHCYQREMRSQIQQVMRYAGPRMLFKHPIFAVQHLFDQIKK